MAKTQEPILQAIIDNISTMDAKQLSVFVSEIVRARKPEEELRELLKKLTYNEKLLVREYAKVLLKIQMEAEK